MIPVAYYFLELTRIEALAILIPAFLIITFFEVVRLRKWRLWQKTKFLVEKMVRKHEEAGDFTGAFYSLLGFCVTIALFESRIVASIALVFIIVGDVAAALIGRKFGKVKFKGKSLEGSLACLAGTALVAYAAFEIANFPLLVGLVGAVVATIVEAIPDFVDDNLSVPVISGLVMTLMLA